MKLFNKVRVFLIPIGYSLALVLSACGGKGNASADSGAPQTAPAIAVVPQGNFNNGGSVDTAKFNAVQTNYHMNLGVTK